MQIYSTVHCQCVLLTVSIQAGMLDFILIQDLAGYIFMTHDYPMLY